MSDAASEKDDEGIRTGSVGARCEYLQHDCAVDADTCDSAKQLASDRGVGERSRHAQETQGEHE